MGKLPRNAFEYIPFQDVTIKDPFWTKRIEATHENTLPAVLKHLKGTGRWDVFRLVWKEGDANPPHIFWDRYSRFSVSVDISDTAKFLEAACYALMKRDDPELRALVEQQIEWIRTSQWDDGYVNSYYTLVEPQNRFTNLRLLLLLLLLILEIVMSCIVLGIYLKLRLHIINLPNKHIF
jgi:uncharacterized protein